MPYRAKLAINLQDRIWHNLRKDWDARIQAAEARSKVSEWKKETQRKILVGAYYLDEARKNNRMQDIQKIMDTYLKRGSDRLLFDLPEPEELGSLE